jgi:hypothetical protein
LTRGGRIRPDLRNPPDPSGPEPDPTQFFKKVKLTRPEPTRDQMTFNPIEIYQRSEKTQHINWPDPADPISSRKSNWPDSSDPNPNPTRPARLSPLVLTLSLLKCAVSICSLNFFFLLSNLCSWLLSYAISDRDCEGLILFPLSPTAVI